MREIELNFMSKIGGILVYLTNFLAFLEYLSISIFVKKCVIYMASWYI